MAKTKTPFLSLASQGSISDTLTSQKRDGFTVMRSKPDPGNVRSLPQMYQRWLYEDYAYLWTRQSAATRAEYSARGSRVHLTGFQYWMKYHLKNLSFIAAIWHLDIIIAGQTPDSSKNASPGTVYGASSTKGVIGDALEFDGLNDVVDCGTGTNNCLAIKDQITIEAYFNADTLTDNKKLVSKYDYQFHIIDFKLTITAFGTSAWFANMFAPGGTIITTGKKYHGAGVYDGHHLITYLHGIPDRSGDSTGQLWDSGEPLIIGAYRREPFPTELFDGMIDHVFIWTIALPQPLLRKHALRRYP